MTKIALKSFKILWHGFDRAFSAWVLAALIPLAVIALDPDNIGAFLETAATALAETFPYIVVAVMMIGYLKASGAETVVASAFEGREIRMIILASLFGGLAPFCSCEVIPFIVGLLAVGAPLSAVMAFWLSSPLIDPPTLLITASALGWKFAIGKAVAAVALGLMGGFLVRGMTQQGIFANPLRPDSAAGGGCCAASAFSGQPNWTFWTETERRRTFVSQASANGLFLLKWLSFAYLLEALLVHYVPTNLISAAVGGEGLLPIVTGALVGAPAYLNSYAAPLLVAGLMEQGMSTGAAMAFMVAGAVSSIPAMAAVWSLVKRPIFAAYLGCGIVGAIIIGTIFQAIA
jgi:hypothetical protein